MGGIEIASSRLRCYFIHNYLLNNGVNSKIGFDKDFDILIVQKSCNYITVDKAYECKKKGIFLIIDVDDFPNDEEYSECLTLLACLADLITTATPEQCDYFNKNYSKLNIIKNKVVCIPNSIDYGLKNPIKKIHKYNSLLNIVWFGNFENAPFEILEIVSSLPDTAITLITNADIKSIKEHFKYNFIPWDLENFSETLSKFDLCILSHNGSEISSAKSSNKMVSSILHGVPVIASATADYTRVAKIGDITNCLFNDIDTLLYLIDVYRDHDMRNTYLEKSQINIYKEFNVEKICNIFLYNIKLRIELNSIKNNIYECIKNISIYYFFIYYYKIKKYLLNMLRYHDV